MTAGFAHVEESEDETWVIARARMGAKFSGQGITLETVMPEQFVRSAIDGNETDRKLMLDLLLALLSRAFKKGGVA